MTLPPAFLDRPIAHRALHDAEVAENSLGAVQRAIAAGYGIEIDIQPSSDTVPMVFHDYDMARLTAEPGPIGRRSAAELGNIALSGGGGHVPTLAEVLDCVAGQVPVLIEIKDQDGGLGPNVGPLEDAVCALVNDYTGDVALMSFNSYSVAACAKHAPDIPRGLVTCPFAPEDWPTVKSKVRHEQAVIPDYDRVGACFISHQQDDLSSPHVSRLRARNVPILCWTIRSPEMEAEARKIADNVTFEGYRA